MRRVTVYESKNRAPREPMLIIMSAEGREMFELGKSEPVIATFIFESYCAP